MRIELHNNSLFSCFFANSVTILNLNATTWNQRKPHERLRKNLKLNVYANLLGKKITYKIDIFSKNYIILKTRFKIVARVDVSVG